MDEDARRERLLLYLYGELPSEQKARFRVELARDPELRLMLEEEERLHRILPIGSGIPVRDDLLAENRRRFRAMLQREEVAPWSRFLRLVGAILPGPARMGYAFAAAVVFLVGILVGRTVFGPSQPAHPVEVRSSSLADLIGPDDLEVTDLRVGFHDPATGRVQVTFEAASSSTVEGRLDDDAIQAILVASLRGDLEPGARLRVVNLLKGQAHRTGIRDALVHVLLSDGNPGVRLKVLEALSSEAAEGTVRKAVLTALVRDRNPGVRVRSLEILRPFRDAEILRVMEAKMTTDDNSYIRSEARRAVIGGTGTPTSSIEKGAGL